MKPLKFTYAPLLRFPPVFLTRISSPAIGAAKQEPTFHRAAESIAFPGGTKRADCRAWRSDCRLPGRNREPGDEIKLLEKLSRRPDAKPRGDAGKAGRRDARGAKKPVIGLLAEIAAHGFAAPGGLNALKKADEIPALQRVGSRPAARCAYSGYRPGSFRFSSACPTASTQSIEASSMIFSAPDPG